MTFTCQACFAEGAALQCSLCQHARYCSQECQQQSPYHTACSKSASAPLNAYQNVINEHGSIVQGLQVGVQLSQIRNALKYLRSNSSELQTLFKSVSTAQCLRPRQFLAELNNFGVAMEQFKTFSAVDFPLLSKRWGIRSEFETKGLATYRERFRSVAYTLQSFMLKFWPILRPHSNRASQVLLLQIRNILEEFLQGDAMLRNTDMISINVIRVLNKLIQFIYDALLDPLAEKLVVLFSWIGRYLSATLAVESIHSTQARSANVHLGLFGTEMYLGAIPSRLLGPKADGDKAMFQMWLQGFCAALRTHGNNGRNYQHILNEPLLKEQSELFCVDTRQLADLLDESDMRFFAQSLIVPYATGLSMVDTCRAIQKLGMSLHHNLAFDPGVQQVQADVAQVATVAEAFQHPLLGELQEVSAAFNQTLKIVTDLLAERLSSIDPSSPEFRIQQWELVGQIARHLVTGEEITPNEFSTLDICVGKPMLKLASEYMRMIQLTYDIEYDLTNDYDDDILDDEADKEERATLTAKGQPTHIVAGDGDIVEAGGGRRGRVLERGHSPVRPPIYTLRPEDRRNNEQQQVAAGSILNVVINTAPSAPPVSSENNSNSREAAAESNRSRSRTRPQRPGQPEPTQTSRCSDLLWGAGKFVALKVGAVLLSAVIITAATTGLPHISSLTNIATCSSQLQVCQDQLQDPLFAYQFFPVPETAPRVMLDLQNSIAVPGKPPPSGAFYDRLFLNNDYTLDMAKVNIVLEASRFGTAGGGSKIAQAVQMIRNLGVNPASLVNLNETNIGTKLEQTSQDDNCPVVRLATFISLSGQDDWDTDMIERIKRQSEKAKPESLTVVDKRLQGICGLVKMQPLLNASLLVGAEGDQMYAVGGARNLPTYGPENFAPAPEARAAVTQDPSFDLPEVEPLGWASYQSARSQFVPLESAVRFVEGEIPLVLLLFYVIVFLLPWVWFSSHNVNVPRYKKILCAAVLYTVGLSAVTIVPKYLGFMDTATLSASKIIDGAGVGETIRTGYGLYFVASAVEALALWANNLIGGFFDAAWLLRTTLGVSPLTIASIEPSYHMVTETRDRILNFFRGEAGASNTLAAVGALTSPSQEIQILTKRMEHLEYLARGMAPNPGQPARPIHSALPPASGLLSWDPMVRDRNADRFSELVRSNRERFSQTPAHLLLPSSRT